MPSKTGGCAFENVESRRGEQTFRNELRMKIKSFEKQKKPFLFEQIFGESPLRKPSHRLHEFLIRASVSLKHNIMVLSTQFLSVIRGLAKSFQKTKPPYLYIYMDGWTGHV